MTPRSDLHIAALSLGGNIGDVAGAFAKALRCFDEHDGVRVVARSQVWRTPPWGKADQPDFLNMAVLVETSLTPHGLLALCLEVERAAGRERVERWGPRTLDIDIIAFDDLTLADETLTLPHPRARERAFVLVPLAEIAGGIQIGIQSVAALAQAADKSSMTVDEVNSSRVAGASD
jgi:2-amino-4-hydroxy-6-hydroxymethyldihydropteridine diphosphokinase